MPHEEISEEELLLRKRARRRLIGAFVVVIVMVLVLPAVLEDKPQPVARDVSIILPPPPPAQPAAVVDVAPSEAPKPADTPPSVPDAATSKTDPLSKPAATEPIAKAAPVAKPSATTGKPTAERFHVQIGVFGNSDNVKQLQSKLAAQGLKLRTETLADGKIRVRAGPYASRAEADKVAGQLRAAGTQGVVVKTGGDKTSKPR